MNDNLLFYLLWGTRTAVQKMFHFLKHEKLSLFLCYLHNSYCIVLFEAWYWPNSIIYSLFVYVYKQNFLEDAKCSRHKSERSTISQIFCRCTSLFRIFLFFTFYSKKEKKFKWNISAYCNLLFHLTPFFCFWTLFTECIFTSREGM